MPANAEALMRSRYSAYVLKIDDYLLATWHPKTRPQELDLASSPRRWLGLKIVRHHVEKDNASHVEFISRYKAGGRGHNIHETSHFVREDGRWLYLDGDA
jgi:SEC-C motif domain protein